MLTSVVLISDRPRRTPPSRHVTKIPSPQLLYFPHLQNCDARNSFRIRSYAKCRVSLTLSFPLPTLRAKRALQVFRNQAIPHSFALFCIFLHSYKTQLISFHALPHSLPKTPGVGVGRLFPFRSSSSFSLLPYLPASTLLNSAR